MAGVNAIRLIAGALALVILLPLYFRPISIAWKKRNRMAIFALNLLAGWPQDQFSQHGSAPIAGNTLWWDRDSAAVVEPNSR